MRLLLKLKSKKDNIYDTKYYHKASGFIYSLLKGTPLEILHDLKTYKFFCFSNIFPLPKSEKGEIVYEIKKGEEFNWLISSPYKPFIEILKEKLEEKNEVNIGEMSFSIEDIKKFEIKLPKRNVRLISATPIIIRIPERNYDKYNIPKEFRKKRYVYWRPNFSFEAFVRQLEENLIKKYEMFYQEKLDGDFLPLFEYFKFKRQTICHFILRGIEIEVVGSIWEFVFLRMKKRKKKLIKFGIDCGFGERNSLGFGFINILLS
jgi:CRISPR-associated endoribonuclease Cas6